MSEEFDGAETPRPVCRKIIHVDMDAFYAQVEQHDDPALRGKPVIVAWSGRPRGVVVAASYEVREYGVRSAMPATRAMRLCPDAIWVKPNFNRYKEVSTKIREIFVRHTDLVEPLSLDEAFLDVTQEKTGIESATETATVIRREILQETEMTASAGIAPNKFLAKIASDWRKPNGQFVIKPHQIDSFLRDLPVRKIPGVGKSTEERMIELGIATVGDMRERTRDELEQAFGKFGPRLWELARGIDERPVVSERRAKSYSSENTFSGDLTLDEVRPHLKEQSREVWDGVAKRGRIARTVTVKLRTIDYRTQTRQVTSSTPPTNFAEMLLHVDHLIGTFDFQDEDRYRLVGVGLSGFLDEDELVQPSLF